MATENLLSSLLTPICQLQESCNLWRAYASCELRWATGSSGGHCRGAAAWNPVESEKESPNLRVRHKIPFTRSTSCERVGTASFKSEPAVSDSQEAMRRAAVNEWHARKSAEIRSGYKTAAQRAKEDEEKRVQAEQDKRDEGKAAYESWMSKKQQSGWTKKTKGNEEAEAEKAKAEAEQKAETQAAIEKWRSRKDAELSQLKRERRRLQQNEEAAKAAEEEGRRQQSSRDKDAWTEKKRQQSRENAKTRFQTERTEADEKFRIEAENREKAKRAYEEWCGRKDGQVSGGSETGGKKFLGPAWRPNSTVRPK